MAPRTLESTVIINALKEEKAPRQREQELKRDDHHKPALLQEQTLPGQEMANAGAGVVAVNSMLQR